MSEREQHEGTRAETMDDFERALLASAKRDGMSDDARRQLFAAVGAAGGAGIAAAASGSNVAQATLATKLASVKWPVTWVALKWIGVGLIGVIAALSVRYARTSDARGGGAGAVATTSSAPPLDETPIAAPADVRVQARVEAPAPAPEAIAPSAPVASASIARAPRESTSPRRASSPPRSSPVEALVTPPPRSLAEEMSLVARARTELQRGRPSETIALLDEHARRFEGGALLDEAEVLRIAALADRGDASRALARADAFLRAHPDSPYAPRVIAVRDRARAAIPPEAP
jgi:hypothetical protein